MYLKLKTIVYNNFFITITVKNNQFYKKIFQDTMLINSLLVLRVDIIVVLACFKNLVADIKVLYIMHMYMDVAVLQKFVVQKGVMMLVYLKILSLIPKVLTKVLLQLEK